MKIILCGAITTAVILALVSVPRSRQTLLEGAIFSSDVRQDLERTAGRRAKVFLDVIVRMTGGLPAAVRPNPVKMVDRANSVALRVTLMGHVALAMLPLIGGSMAFGLARRQSASRGMAWSSSVRFLVGGYLVILSAIVAAAFACSSTHWAIVYVPFVLLVVGCYLILGNLPCRV